MSEFEGEYYKSVDGKLRLITSYTDGRHGTRYTYYDDGKTVRGKFTYDHGTLVSADCWYNNGLRSKSRYVNGDRHGVCESFFRSGVLRCSVSHDHGKLHGESVYWYQDGSVTKKQMYIDGRKHGRSYYYHERTLSWYGTTDETRGRKITREAHDAEMEAFCPKLDIAFVIPWLFVARRMGVMKDIARLIAEMLIDESDLQVVYWRIWLGGFQNER
jgi:hypothetical protein